LHQENKEAFLFFMKKAPGVGVALVFIGLFLNKYLFVIKGNLFPYLVSGDGLATLNMNLSGGFGILSHLLT